MKKNLYTVLKYQLIAMKDYFEVNLDLKIYGRKYILILY